MNDIAAVREGIFFCNIMNTINEALKMKNYLRY